MVNRRFFIGGAGAFGALSLFGARPFAASAGTRRGAPNLRLGVLSDIHIARLARTGEPDVPGESEIAFQKALEWYRDQEVDAVLLAGDMADWGYGDALLYTMAAWERVFPGDRAPDGRRVERVFIYGNHENYSASVPYARRLYPDEQEWARRAIKLDMPGWWRKAFHEDYSRLYEKEVRGYRFIGCHWDSCSASGDPHALIGPYMKDKGAKLDPSRPFFYLQHPALKDTCNGPWAWDHDSGAATRAFSSCPNAVAISGHTHYSLTDERSIWQGAFTSVGAGSFCYTGLPEDGCPPVGYENTGCPPRKDAKEIDAAKMMPYMATRDCHQGSLWEVYDDCIVMKRREFGSGLSLGADWVVPLASRENRPFAFAEHAKRVGTPQFAPDAKLVCERIKAKSRAGQEKDAVRVTAPAVVADARARAFDLSFAAHGAQKEKKVKLVMAEGFNLPISHARARKATACVFALDELPNGLKGFSVMPRNCFGKKGRPLTAAFSV